MKIFSVPNVEINSATRIFSMRISFSTGVPFWRDPLPPFSPSGRFSRPHKRKKKKKKKKKRNEASRFFRTSVINYGRNLGQRRRRKRCRSGPRDGEEKRERRRRRSPTRGWSYRGEPRW
ncbi:hypothetical protein PUN28_016166 [Cardiocondyla obscurior]|uniref:Uncharacterized protein n=1 Tax=Cardiocondyla obscurior TaxID=286306 RepID=A0AAW2ESZ8_9HYME